MAIDVDSGVLWLGSGRGVRVLGSGHFGHFWRRRADPDLGLAPAYELTHRATHSRSNASGASTERNYYNR